MELSRSHITSMRSHKKTGIQVAVLARMSSQTSAGADVADSPAEAPAAVSEILSQEVKAQEAPSVCETSDSSRCAVLRSAYADAIRCLCVVFKCVIYASVERLYTMICKGFLCCH